MSIDKQTEEQANKRPAWMGHWAWDVVSGALLVIYVALTLHYAHTLLSRLDEGLYTVKGYFFAIGKYWPYQDYGPLTNHMPLSFLIPGYVQKWFGPGIRVSRHYAVVMGTLTMLGLWLTARRLGGRAWGSAALLSVVVSPYLVKTYSLELSQVLVAAMLSWTLFFVLGEERKTWQLVVGGLLAGMAMMTRLNLAALLPFMLLYILWQYGWRKALATGTAGGLVVLVLHAIYWPGILRMWAYWVPQGIFGFLDPYYEPWRKTFAFHREPISTWIGNIESVQWNPVIAFWQGMRFYFPGLTAAFATMLLWPKRRAWGSAQRFRQTLVLVGLFLVLLGMHMWAALGGNSCHIFCYLNYLTFFYILGPLMLISSLSIWQVALPKWRSIPIILFVCLYLAGIGFSAARQVAPPIGDILVPRVSGGSFQSGSIELWGLLANKFNLNYLESI
ncbi:MAG: glycosyltransferase family 39 protein, partial [Anaerolineales bacterium]|nr:glycosyltransferase family 39 protein [Anaerolineales bacterium]